MILYLILPIIFQVTISNGFANESQDLYSKCYAHFTNSVLSPNNLVLKSINEGKISAVTACLDILNLANINEKTNTINLTDEQTDLRIRVLKTFNDFHRSWFTNKDFLKALDTGDCAMNNSKYVWDSGESALHLTNALFGNNQNFSSIVTNPNSFKAIRKTSNPDKTKSIFGINEPARFLKYDTIFYPTYVDFGQLIGLTLVEAEFIDDYLTIKEFKTSQIDISPKKSINFRKAYGAGIIGSTPYLLLNLGRKPFDEVDGGLIMGRRWSKAIISEFFCRDLPVINTNDAKKFVNKNSTVPFRSSSSCMMCHATMDSLAGGIRNLTYINSTKSCSALRLPLLFENEVTYPAEDAIIDLDPNFSKRPPKGSLFFRSYNGKLININFTGLEELGKVISNIDDLYICASKRYFSFLTGIDIDISPLDNNQEKNLSQNFKNHRNFLIKSGLNLKKHQSLKLLLKEIIESPFYTSKNKGFN